MICVVRCLVHISSSTGALVLRRILGTDAHIARFWFCFLRRPLCTGSRLMNTTRPFIYLFVLQ